MSTKVAVFLACLAIVFVFVVIGEYALAGAVAAAYIVCDLIFSHDHGGLGL